MTRRRVRETRRLTTGMYFNPSIIESECLRLLLAGAMFEAFERLSEERPGIGMTMSWRGKLSPCRDHVISPIGSPRGVRMR